VRDEKENIQSKTKKIPNSTKIGAGKYKERLENNLGTISFWVAL